MTTLDEEDRGTDSDHGFALHNPHSAEIVEEARTRSFARRRTFATLAVAVCLGGAGLIIGLAMVQGQRASDERATREALEREELRDGWKTLGAAATDEAQRLDVPPVSEQPAATAGNAPPSALPPSSATAPVATNIVVVNVPVAQPSKPGTVVVTPAVPTGNYTPAPPMQSVATDSTPIVTYVPLPAASPNVPNVNNGAVVPDQNVGNGTIPGSAPNPTLPNGAPSVTPQPIAPNATTGGLNAPSATPSAPVGTVPAAP